jgi:hypothetical protein
VLTLIAIAIKSILLLHVQNQFYVITQHQTIVSINNQREWNKRSRKHKRRGTTQELAPIRHEKEIETNIGNKPISNEIPPTNTNFHAMKLEKTF